MRVDVIDEFAAFEAIRANWNSVYAADPDANLFLSWDWMSKWLPEVETDWLILAAAPDASAESYVAFFPLRLRTKPAKAGGFYTEIVMAGNSFADYTGAIIDPEHADAAIDAFARSIAAMNWRLVRFDSMRMSVERHERLIRHFQPASFEIFVDRPMLDSSGVDNSICPFAVLPDSWDGYLSGLSANTRQKLRRLLRKLDADPDLRITHATPQTVDRTIEILIDLWTRQWGHRKGDGITSIHNNLWTMLRHYADLGILYMPTLWRGEEPAGVLASIVDPQKRVMHFCIGGREERHSDLQPGLLLHAHSIRHAIEMGLTLYDFLRGNERYKYSFGSHERRICNTVVRQRAGLKKLLDARSIPRALSLLNRQTAEADLAGAEVGYRQVLSLDPRCGPAMLGYAELKLAQGQPKAAEALIQQLLAKQESVVDAWLMLGRCLAAQRRWSQAEAAYAHALQLKPQLAAAYYHMGRMSEARGSAAEAQLSYKQVLAIDPDFRDARQRLVGVMMDSVQEKPRAGAPLGAGTSLVDIHQVNYADRRDAAKL